MEPYQIASRDDVRQRDTQAHERIMGYLRRRFKETGEVFTGHPDIVKGTGLGRMVVARIARRSSYQIVREHGNSSRLTYVGPCAALLDQWRGVL